jgi:aspartate/methionine/tyrosine aminotransferase
MTSKPQLSNSRYQTFAKTTRNRVRETLADPIIANEGGQYFDHPTPEVMKVEAYAATHYTGLLGFLAAQAQAQNIPLEQYIGQYTVDNGYFANLPQAYQRLWKKVDPEGKMNFGQFLAEYSREEVPAAPYLERSFGQLETAEIMAAYFEACGISDAPKGKVMVGSNGFKSLYAGVLGAIFTDGPDNEYARNQGALLVPRGHYQSITKALPIYGAKAQYTPGEVITAADVEEALLHRDETNLKAIYLPCVGNPSGLIPSEEENRKIAAAILRYNRDHKDNPVYVISDEVYRYSNFTEAHKDSSVAGIAIEGLGSLGDYTVTITSPSKTFGFATARVGFSITNNSRLQDVMKEFLTDLGTRDVHPPLETAAVAAMVLTPRRWVEQNNQYYLDRFHEAQGYVERINERFRDVLGEDAIVMEEPHGGWFTTLRFPKSVFSGKNIDHSMDMMLYLLAYGKGGDKTGISLKEGAVHGYEDIGFEKDPYITMRASLALSPARLKEMYERMEDAMGTFVAMDRADVTQMLEQIYNPNKQATRVMAA